MLTGKWGVFNLPSPGALCHAAGALFAALKESNGSSRLINAYKLRISNLMASTEKGAKDESIFIEIKSSLTLKSLG